ncbi:hypothetical protein NCCP2716_12640 [Sporosarcina sp. NCCP-2716]|uniref:phosphotransferase n=1 Tax=Sporosarcina sp. NCCP-2716 TaxID=2943679 RepID=UPI00203B402A|nr:phosphotransferase [Sporosarcina sp. NCCP-2716]GKV68766.1 hypothetical protein NCCP2716_12640 [Sporosarcina sp. NCCP-2716]
MDRKRETLFYEVKPHVWRIEEDGQMFAVKRYKNQMTADKVRKLHDQLLAVEFPFIAPLSEKGTGHLVIQPWLTDTKPVDFAAPDGRRASLDTLDALHATRDVIDWEAAGYLPRFRLLNKWEHRLQRFRHNEQLVTPYIGSSAFEQFLTYGERALDVLKAVGPDDGPMTVLHGDVVHHNLLAAEDGTVYLIDFDLAAAGSPSVEIALWMHRVLPHVGYDAEALCSELPRLRQLSDVGIAMLRYPNEVLREWNYFAGLPDMGRRQIAGHLTRYTKQALGSWERLCEFSENELDRRSAR